MGSYLQNGSELRLDAVGRRSLGVIVFVLVMFVGVTLLAVRERRAQAATARKLDTRVGASSFAEFKQSRLLRFVEEWATSSPTAGPARPLGAVDRAGYMSRPPWPSTPVKMVLFHVGLIVTAFVLPWRSSARRSCWSLGARSRSSCRA
jgi:hypothetical protein